MSISLPRKNVLIIVVFGLFQNFSASAEGCDFVPGSPWSIIGPVDMLLPSIGGRDECRFNVEVHESGFIRRNDINEGQAFSIELDVDFHQINPGPKGVLHFFEIVEGDGDLAPRSILRLGAFLRSGEKGLVLAEPGSDNVGFHGTDQDPRHLTLRGIWHREPRKLGGAYAVRFSVILGGHQILSHQMVTQREPIGLQLGVLEPSDSIGVFRFEPGQTLVP